MIAPPLNDEQKAFIKAHYIELNVAEMSRQIQKSTSAIWRYMRAENLTIPLDILQARKEKGRFTKNFTPHNKGKKMPPEVYEKVKHTMFKPGNGQEGAKFEFQDGDGYTIVKHDGKWQLKHRLIYTQHCGPIDSDMLVVFKDGNKQNLDINNLELITKEENLRRNQTTDRRFLFAKDLSDNYVSGIIRRQTQLTRADVPSELIEMKRVTLKMNRELKKIAKNESK